MKSNTKQSDCAKWQRSLKKMAAPLLCGLFFYALFQFVLFIGYVPSASMEPTISANSFVLGTRIFGELQRGDIVIFKHEDRILVKRIAALPGDTIIVDTNGAVHVSDSSQNNRHSLVVPEGHYYVLGDNKESSIDSRCWLEPFVWRGHIIARRIGILSFL